MVVVPPKRLRILAIKPYVGTTDKMDHLDLFTSHMMVQDASDAMWCRVFLEILKGYACAWYSNLAHHSITSFTQLRSSFLAHFAPLRRHQRSTMAFISLKQNQGESLKGFISRFNMEALSIENFDDSVAMVAFHNALRPGLFAQSLAKTPSLTFTYILGWAMKYINAKEVMQAERVEYTMKKKRKKHSEENKSEGRREDQKEKHHPQAPFNKRNRNKYCRFHQDHGHNTEECHQLKEEIQELINWGFLRSFIAREMNSQKGREWCSWSSPPRRDRAEEWDRVRNLPRRKRPLQTGEDHPQPPVFHTLTVREVLGAKGKEDSRVAQTSGVQSSKRGEIISFSNNNLPGYPNQNDLLVITAKLGKWELRQILVNPGSSSKILYRQAFLGIGY
ncbi:uncharacterized protein LOC127811127 [Diospyros lotus]|uniref:uncharacterized protein LOC127811127 n=1 Tax=Diospyros lotus TaxID=55363 RepID=UPI00224DFD2F|nr:uncharacterized protein LOC127811127 [Diospyros lotus]